MGAEKQDGVSREAIEGGWGSPAWLGIQKRERDVCLRAILPGLRDKFMQQLVAGTGGGVSR